MLCLPECFSYIGEKWQDTVAAGQTLDEPNGVITEMRSQAAADDIWLSLGGFPEKVSSAPSSSSSTGGATNDSSDSNSSSSIAAEKVFNTHLIIDNTGNIAAIYRKIHLFDVVSIHVTIVNSTNLNVASRLL